MYFKKNKDVTKITMNNYYINEWILKMSNDALGSLVKELIQSKNGDFCFDYYLNKDIIGITNNENGEKIDIELNKEINMKWIKCSERLPEDGQTVLFLTIANGTAEGYIEDYGSFSKIFGTDYSVFYSEINDFGTYYKECEVLAWMPYPDFKGG